MRRLVVALVALPLVACGGATGDDTTEHDHSSMPVAPASVMGEPDVGFSGPQGRSAQFVVECEFSHSLTDDPIVYPDQAGASHLHVFFGNRTVDADSTYESMIGQDTTCDHPLDHASYWAPTLMRGGEMIEPVKSTAYYRPGPGIDPASVQPFPAGLMMIAGDPFAAEPQSTKVVAFTCGTGAEREPSPPNCQGNRTVRMIVTFPDCWDGENLDTEGHRAHMHYSTAGECPATHPVAVPQLTFTVQYPVTGDPTGLALSSGGVHSGHADFVNAWDQDELAEQVRICLNRDIVCGITSGRKTG